MSNGKEQTMNGNGEMRTGPEVGEIQVGTGRRSHRLTRICSGLAVGLVAAGSVIGLGMGAASATVANNGVNWAYPNVEGTGCQVVVGDEQSVILAAIGEADVTRCSRNYPLVVITYLDFSTSPSGKGAKTVAENWRSGLTYQIDVATNNYNDPSGMCGKGYWETNTQVSFNGGATYTPPMASNDGYRAFPACNSQQTTPYAA
jgi:hypothetical protein